MKLPYDRICDIARAAGAEIMRIYEGSYTVDSKSDSSPLTCADLAAHALIERELRALAPEIPILSEEGSEMPWQERREWTRFWLVDPLDGTKEFIKRNGEFTVNIALICGSYPVFGVVYAPALGRMYWGGEGTGAFLQAGDEAARPIGVRPAGDALAVVVSRSHPSPELDGFLKDVNVSEEVAVGSSLKFCVVAEGRADLYPRFGPTCEWDTAAGQAVLEAAGGTVTDLAGERMAYNKESLLNGYFVARGAERVRGA